MRETTCFVIAYWGDDEDVAFVGMGTEDLHYDGTFRSIASAYQRYICDGHITEVLEVMHTTVGMDGFQYAHDRCDYWREELREQGYAISRPKGEEE